MMTSPSFQNLHQKALEASQKYLTSEKELVFVLQEIDRKKAWFYLGYRSLFQYATEALKLSESQSQSFIVVARACHRFEYFKKVIEESRLSVSKACRITSVLNQRDEQDWVSKALSLSKRDLEREVASVHPREKIPEKARYLNAQDMELHLCIHHDLYQKLQRVKDLAEAVSIEGALEELCEFYLQKKDPVKKAERVIQKNKTKSSPHLAQARHHGNPAKDFKISGSQNLVAVDSERVVPNSENSESQNLEPSTLPGQDRSIPAEVIHEVYHRDRGQCQYTLPSGVLCGSGRWIHLHHKRPRYKGGAHELNNLLSLCSTHHRVIHQKKNGEYLK